MPHQLLRIIGINIRSTKTGIPSGSIAMLDVRGSVLALGINGIGKTTFLRLMPLFYGATPMQILKGTGHHKMIAHTLPDPSSAVVFEYEREAGDFRIAVMHCKPDQDMAEFYIVKSAFEERFFFENDNDFVRREHFKAHVERMDVVVSKHLSLSEYRSVILGEHTQVKGDKELRRLASQHSIGPSALPNLNQIAAAMANEQIQFRDLQNIVIDHVSSAQTADASNNKAFRKTLPEVNRWFSDYAHLALVMKSQDAAKTMNGRVDTILSTVSALGCLHADALQALDLARERSQALVHEQVEDRKKHQETIQDRNGTLQSLIEERKELLNEERKSRTALDAAIDKRNGFVDMKATDLSIEQENEAQLLTDRQSREASSKILRDTSVSVHEKLRANLLEIERAYGVRVGDHARDQAANHAEASDRRHAIDEAEQVATAALKSESRIVRLAEIASGLDELAREKGGLESLVKRPHASEETNRKLVVAEHSLEQEDEKARAALTVEKAAASEKRNASTARDQLLRTIEQLESALAMNRQQVDALQKELVPRPGSLFEFLERSNALMWSEEAKLIAPDLLERTDLQPRMVGDFVMAEPGFARLGPFEINLSNIAVPSWTNKHEVEEKIRRIEEAGKGISVRLEETNGLLSKATKAFDKASASLAEAESDSQRFQRNAQNARTNVVTFKQNAEHEKHLCKSEALKKLDEVSDKQQVLVAEKRSIEQDDAQKALRLREDFKSQRAHLTRETEERSKRIAEAEKSSFANYEDSKVQAHKDRDHELQSLGVDIDRVTLLEREIAAIEERLVKIATHRHTVAAWKSFQSDVEPQIPSYQVRKDQASVALKNMDRRKTELVQEIETLEERLAQSQKMIDGRISANRLSQESLESLLGEGMPLRKFKPTTSQLPLDWSAEGIRSSVTTHLHAFDLEMGNLEREVRKIHNVMAEQASPIATWLQSKERETLARIENAAEHHILCAKARMLYQWYSPSEHREYVRQINSDMDTYFTSAQMFIDSLDMFDRNIKNFNLRLQKALLQIKGFHRFGELSVTVLSGIKTAEKLGALRMMTERAREKNTFMTQLASAEMPSTIDIELMHTFRQSLPQNGTIDINFSDQVKLQCELREGGNRKVITNDEEFKGVSSTGNRAIIIAMFLLGFVQMIRGDSPVHLTWITDEIGRFDPSNMQSFLKVLSDHNVNVIGAAPTSNPLLSRFYTREALFEDDGSIQTADTNAIEEEVVYAD